MSDPWLKKNPDYASIVFQLRDLGLSQQREDGSGIDAEHQCEGSEGGDGDF